MRKCMKPRMGITLNDISLELQEGDDTGERGRGGREGKFLSAAFLDCDHMGC